MVQRPILKLAGTLVGQIVYYVLLAFAWMWLGWNATFLGLIAVVVACIVNPLLCASLANQVRPVQKKLSAVAVWLVLLCIVLACAPLSTAIWLHASGYYRHAISNSNDYVGETTAWDQLLGIIGMVISGILFVVRFSILKARETSRMKRDSECST